MIVCVAIVGQQNNPLYVQVFPPAEGDQLLKFHYVVHCSLDAIEEKGALAACVEGGAQPIQSRAPSRPPWSCSCSAAEA